MATNDTWSAGTNRGVHARSEPAGEQVHAVAVDEALRGFASAVSGLSEAEAVERLRQYGPNAILAAPPTSAWKILLDQLRSVVVLLLILAVGVSLVAGDALDAAVIAGVLAMNTLLGFVVEIRARRAMESLLRLEVARAVVVRDGRAREVDARELVPGDVVEIEAGIGVPADARLIAGADVRVDESALTGESLPVAKTTDAVAVDAPLAERTGMLYRSTSVVGGVGRALVVATGASTEIGRIGQLVGTISEERTPLERRLDALGRQLVWVALSTGLLVVAIGAVRGMPWSQLVESGLALAVAAVPEGLPAVATVALALGVHRMARRNALVRRLPSVETLGSVTVVCTDKTGTLTAGEPTVTELVTIDSTIAVTGGGFEPVGDFREGDRVLEPPFAEPLASALRVAMLANRARIGRAEGRWTVEGDPTEAALIVVGEKARLTRDALLERWPQVAELPFSSERLLMATYHRAAADEPVVAFVKGAPGRILDLTDRVLSAQGERPLGSDDRRILAERNHELAARGLRVLALACGTVSSADEVDLKGLVFLGLVGMTDPVAAGVAAAIDTFRAAGIRTVMVTGDQRQTAGAIARELGIVDDAGGVLDGREVTGLDDTALAARICDIGAFSRISPEDKLRIVRALQARGEIVAMLGDGVNDAPALRQADVGVAMGMRGTDVAKEAADIVLQDDRFSTIGAAIEEGRVVFDNIQKFVFYLFSCNVAEVLVVLVGSVLVREQPLLALQILWLNLVTDSFPALALALEPGEGDIMRRRPRDPAGEIFSGPFVRDVVLYAALITGVTLAAFVLGRSRLDGDTRMAVTMSFMTLALAQVLHLGNARRRGRVISPREALRNPWAVGAVLLVFALQAAAVHFEPLARVLGTVPLGWREWLAVVALASVPAIVGQASKPAPEPAVSPSQPSGSASGRAAA